MSYLVLARKYRPRDFDALVGQPHVVQALANALTQQRLHHAYLFTGTRGVGKTTISRILAKSLNCTGSDGSGGITAQPCGVCESCAAIDAGRFIDYVELDAASNRGVDEISQLLDQSVYKPVIGRFKVYMIDEVHMLSNHAFNAMLKTLEEPPEYLKFVLATTDPQKVPPTVLSRCLQFNLRPLAPQTVNEHLGKVLAEEGIVAAQAALHLIARAARGSMRDALSLADQAIAFGAGAIDEAGVRQMLGAVDRGHAMRLVGALAARDGGAVIRTIDRLRELGLSAAGTLEEMAALLQEMAVRQAVPDTAEDAEADAEEAAETARLAALLPADETQLLYSIVLHGRAEIALAPDEYSGLVMVLLRLLAFAPQAERSAAPQATPTPPSVSPSRSTAARAMARAEGPAVAPVRVLAAEPAVSENERPSSPAIRASAPDSQPRGATAGASTPAPGSTDLAGSSDPALRASQAAATDASVSTLRGAAHVPPLAVSASSPAASVPVAPAAASLLPSAPVSAPAVASAVASTVADASVSASASASPSPFPSASALALASRSTSASARAAAPAVEVALPVGFSAALGDRWVDVVQRMTAAGSISAWVRELAMQAQCVEIDEAVAPPEWRLRVEREMLRAPAHAEKLQAALSELLGGEVKIRTEPGAVADTPARREAAERARRQAEAEATFENDPLVKALMAQYKTARIVPGSVKSL